MSKKLSTIMTTAILIIGALASAIPAYAATVTVDANQDWYTAGDKLSASGTVSPVTSGQAVTVEVTGPAGFPGAFAIAIPTASGSWSATDVTAFISSYPTGMYTISAKYDGVSASKTVTFSTTGIVVNLDKAQYRAGDSISVTGTVPVLQAGQAVTLQITGPAGFPGTFATATPDSDLAFSSSNIVTMISSYPEGTYTVTASYPNTGSTLTTFSYLPTAVASNLAISSVSLTPSTVSVGTTYTVRAVISSNTTVTSVSAGSTALTNQGGTWSGTLTAPSAVGKYTITVTATEENGSTATRSATLSVVIASLKLTPNFGVPGAAISYTGSDLGSSKVYTVTLDFNGLPVALAKGTTGVDGAISGVFKIPSVPTGVYTITAEDADGRAATTSLGVGILLRAELTLHVTGSSAVFPGEALTLYVIATFNDERVDPSFTTHHYTAPFLAQLVNLDAPTKIHAGFYSIKLTAPAAAGTYGVHVEAKYEAQDGRLITGAGLTSFEVTTSVATEASISKIISKVDDVGNNVNKNANSINGIEKQLGKQLGDINSQITSSTQEIQNTIDSSAASLQSAISEVGSAVSTAAKSINSGIGETSNNISELDNNLTSIREGVANATTFVLVVTALAAITVVLELAILIRKR